MLYTSKIQLHMTMEELHNMLERYHYEEKDLELLTHLYHAVEPVIDAWCCYETEPSYDFVSYEQEQYMTVLVTLGKGIDRMAEVYGEASCIEEAYMLDCIGSELLWISYGKIQQIIQETHGLWQTSLEFLGDRYPVEHIAEVVGQMNREWNRIYLNDPNCLNYGTQAMSDMEPFEKKIQCNEVCLLTPEKSVVYIAKVQKTKPEQEQAVCRNLCENCGNSSCQNRMKMSIK